MSSNLTASAIQIVGFAREKSKKFNPMIEEIDVKREPRLAVPASWGRVLGAPSYLFLAFLFGMLALIPRWDGFDGFPGKYLWAEDGSIFLNEVQELGSASLLKSYAGYLLLYPRLVVLLASNFALVHQPMVLLAGWLLAYLFMVYAIAAAARYLGLGKFASLSLIVFSSLQPNYGENFFNVTNAQWLLGTALIIMSLVDFQQSAREKLFKNLISLPLALTGPFSIVLSPLLLLKMAFLKDWSNNKWNYLAVFAGAMIQLATLLASGRATSGEISDKPWEWVFSFLQIAMFGANSFAALLAALTFWLIVISLVVRASVRGPSWPREYFPSLLLLGCALLFIFAGQYSNKQYPLLIVALGGGNRYSWIPYVLIFMSAFSLAARSWHLQTILIALVGFLCYQNFHPVAAPDLQFGSFARFSEHREVNIPLNPQWAAYPGWHIKARPAGDASALEPASLKLVPESLAGAGANLIFSESEQGVRLQSLGTDPMLLFKDAIACRDTAHAALEINMTRDAEGWMQLFWSEKPAFNEKQSLRRWYPAGQIHAQFAFPLSSGLTRIRFDPMDGAGAAAIREIRVYCFN